jgi:hypothetical protein
VESQYWRGFFSFLSFFSFFSLSTFLSFRGWVSFSRPSTMAKGNDMKQQTTSTGQFMAVYDHDTIWPKIIETIASGRSLASALREPGMPSYARAKQILRDNAELRYLYEQAKIDRADALADDLIDLVSQPIPDELEGSARGAFVQHLRLQADIRKWLAARLHAVAYSDHVSISVTNTHISITQALKDAEARLIDLNVTGAPSRVIDG